MCVYFYNNQQRYVLLKCDSSNFFFSKEANKIYIKINGFIRCSFNNQSLPFIQKPIIHVLTERVFYNIQKIMLFLIYTNIYHRKKKILLPITMN